MISDLTDDQIRGLAFAISECLVKGLTIGEVRRLQSLVNIINCNLQSTITLLTSPLPSLTATPSITSTSTSSSTSTASTTSSTASTISSTKCN